MAYLYFIILFLLLLFFFKYLNKKIILSGKERREEQIDGYIMKAEKERELSKKIETLKQYYKEGE